MKQLTVIFAFLVLAGCQSTTQQPAVAAADMPAGAIQEPFDDNPNIVKVTVQDTQGNITAYGIYENGLREGSWTELHPTGHVMSITGYHNGVKEGAAVELDNRGQLLERFTYHNGKLHGPYTKYNRSRVKETKNYANGVLEGEVKVYYDNAKVMEESFYKNGKREGIARWYDQDGNLSIEYEYKDGVWLKDKEEEGE